MFFLSLFLILVAILVLLIKYFLIITGKKVQGKIVGFKKASRSTHGIIGYSYTIQLEYNDEIYLANSVQSKSGNNFYRPAVPHDNDCIVYFNPKYPHVVSMTGTYGLEITSGFLFLLGFLGMILAFS